MMDGRGNRVDNRLHKMVDDMVNKMADDMMHKLGDMYWTELLHYKLIHGKEEEF